MKKNILVTGALLLLFSSFTLSVNADNKVEQEKQESLEEVVVSDHQMNLSIDINVPKTTYTVGEQGKLEVSAIEGVVPRGEFKEITDNRINLKADGSFTLLETGKIEIQPEFILSKESENEIKEAYIKNNNLTNVSVDDIEIIVKDIATNILLEVSDSKDDSKKVTIDVTPHFNIDKTDLTIGETAKLTVDPINGIEVTGEFYLVGDDANFEIKSDGVVLTKKIGKKLALMPSFKLSDQSAQALFEAKKKELGDESLTIDEVDFIVKEIQQIFDINVEYFTITMRPGVILADDTIEVGKSTSMSFKNEYGVTPKGAFKEFKNEFIEVKADGTIIGLKAGETSFSPSYDYTDETWEKIAKAYFEKNGITNVSVGDVQFATQEIAEVVTIKVVDPNQGGGGSGGNGKTYEPVKTLPQTGEKAGIFLTLIGSLTAIGSVVLLKFRTK